MAPRCGGDPASNLVCSGGESAIAALPFNVAPHLAAAAVVGFQRVQLRQSDVSLADPHAFLQPGSFSPFRQARLFRFASFATGFIQSAIGHPVARQLADAGTQLLGRRSRS